MRTSHLTLGSTVRLSRTLTAWATSEALVSTAVGKAFAEGAAAFPTFMEYLYYLLAGAAYVALIWGLPRVLPQEASPLLRWLHWGASVLCLLALAVPALTRGSSIFRSLASFFGVLLVSGLLAGAFGAGFR
jgi:hypothetical protein